MIKKILFIPFIALCISSQAQNNGATIHVFQPNEPNTSYSTVTQVHKDSMRHMDRNCLKWNWSVLTRGVFLFDYEIYLGSNLSLEVGAGITYRDFLFEWTKTIGGDTIQQFSSNTNTSDFGTATPKISGEAGLKYYPSGFDNMEGIYLEATISYRSYSFPNPGYTPVVGGNGYVPGYNFLDEEFKFGYDASRWFSDFTTEFYIGIGIRNATVNTYQDVSVYSLNNIYPVTSEAYKPITLHATYPQPLLGFKIGYTF
jgi:hypothetical protein